MPQSCRSASVTGPGFRSIAAKLNQETKLENVISNDIKSAKLNQETKLANAISNDIESDYYVAYQGKRFDGGIGVGGISPSWKQPLFKPAVG
uniref:Uncharacterized protein n=1 Tax=Salix viminalis TaxID=40686 RepID=A0A6N2LWS8_SALVM